MTCIKLLHVACFLLGNCPVSEFYMPTFRNSLSVYTYLPMKMEQTECSETSAYKIQTPGYYPEKNIHHTEYGESFKSRKLLHVSSPECHPQGVY